jgi:hypothetical protein
MSRAARISVAALVMALWSGCYSTVFQARRAPLGDPATPAARVDGVDQWDFSLPAGVTDDTKEMVEVEQVTSSGFHRTSDSKMLEPAIVWDVRLQGGDAGVEVHAMIWGAATSPRCQGEHTASDLMLDPEGEPATGSLESTRQVRWERPLVVRGERVLSGRFERDTDLFGRPSVIDLLLTQPGSPDAVCVRVPLSGPGVEYRTGHRWSPGVRVEWREALPFATGGAGLVGLSLGRWVGPVRVGLEGIIGVAGDRGGSLGLLGSALEASGTFAIVSPHWRLGWSAAFEALWAWQTETKAQLEQDQKDNRVEPVFGAAGGLRLGLRLITSAQAPPGLSPFGPSSGTALELFAATEHEWTGELRGSRLDFGLALVAF